MKINFTRWTVAVFASLLIFAGCNPTVDSGNNSGNPENSGTPEKPFPDAEITIDGSDSSIGWAFYTKALSESDGKYDIDFSVEMAVVNSGSSEAELKWNINSEGYPTLASQKFPAGKTFWTKVSGSKKDFDVKKENQLYLDTYGLTKADFKIYLKNISLTVTPKVQVPEGTWLDAAIPSLKETYKDIFDSIGIAAEYGNFGLSCSGDKFTGTYTHSGWGTPSELYYEEVQNGIAKHADSITLGNELKPQFLLQWWDGSIGSSETLIDFTASNGKTVKVPSKLNGESLIYATLNVCKKMNVRMRGHVLTWHSQTPDGFFAENYTPVYNGDLISNMVSKEEMTARHEWYIKTVLKCVADWEDANNYRAIWAWDVVNEAMADDAGKTYTGDNQNWLRGSTAGTKNKAPDNGGGSRWYQVYGNEEFIINAFRFANAYAPSDVKLCYNDYNEYMDYSAGWKTSAIEHIVGLIKAGEAKTVNGNSVAPRIDVIAMQSHVGTNWPGVSGYEAALKRFLALCDVHVSEIDFAAETQESAETAWGEYFAMLKKYGKNYSGAHKITNVTIWGINNESSWINPSTINEKIVKTYPLLFNLVNNVDGNKKDVTYDTGAESLPQYDVGDTYRPNKSFWAVIGAR